MTNNENFSDEIVALQKEFDFGVQVKKVCIAKTAMSELLKTTRTLYHEILTALGTSDFSFFWDDSQRICSKIPLFFPCAIANKIAKMLLQLPIEQRLCFLEWAKEEADKAKAQMEELENKKAAV